MINTPTVQKLIEDNKVGALGKAIEDSAEYYKMQSFNQALLAALARDQITLEEALSYSPNPNDLKIRLQTEGIVVASAPAAPARPFGLRP
jgi:Tfp pilus assembly pilus retraction ATPase PilT